MSSSPTSSKSARVIYTLLRSEPLCDDSLSSDVSVPPLRSTLIVRSDMPCRCRSSSVGGCRGRSAVSFMWCACRAERKELKRAVVTLGTRRQSCLPSRHHGVVLGLLARRRIIAIARLTASLRAARVAMHESLGTLTETNLLGHVHNNTVSVNAVGRPTPTNGTTVPRPSAPRGADVNIVIPRPDFF